MAQTNKSKNMLQVYGYHENGDRYSIHSRRLSDSYVYYQQLLDKNNPPELQLIGKAVDVSMKVLGDTKEQFDTIYRDKLGNMANNELKKEVEFLNKNFNSQKNPEKISEKELVEAINHALGLKGQYERASERIINAAGQITPTKSFSGYFNTAWNNRQKNLINSIKGLRSKDLIAAKIEDELRDAIKEAMRAMFTSSTWPSKAGGEDVYKDLLDAIDSNSPTGNDLLDSLYKSYHLEDIRKKIMDVLNQNAKLAGKEKVLNTIAEHIKNTNRTSSGTFYEYAEQEALGLMAHELNNMRLENNQVTIEIHVEHTGQTNMKADNILSFGFDLSPIYNSLNEAESTISLREHNIKGIKNFQNKLKEQDAHGTLVYISDKDYAIGKKFAGFSAGIQKLKDFEASMSGYVSKDVIGTIRQTLDGAIGSEYKGTVEHVLAADVARWLFDDFDTIGDVPLSDVNAIHLMSLDGVYVPLSVILRHLSEAFGTNDEGEMVTVKIEDKNILWYSTPADGWSPQKWEQQRDDARDMQIEVHFLAGISKLLKELG